MRKWMKDMTHIPSNFFPLIKERHSWTARSGEPSSILEWISQFVISKLAIWRIYVAVVISITLVVVVLTYLKG